MPLPPGAPLLALLLLALGPSAAHAQGIVRAASHGPGIAVSLRERGRFEPRILASVDGSSFVDVSFPSPRWVLDLHVLDDGTVLVASGEVPRGGEVRVARIAPGTTNVASETVVAGSDSISDAYFVAGRGQLSLVSAMGAFVSRDDGRRFRRTARWTTDVYAFYAATAAASPTGVLDVLAPTFNTCGSSDLLEELLRLRVDRRGRVHRERIPLERFGAPVIAAVGRSGTVYTAHRDGVSCVLRAHDGRSGPVDLDRFAGAPCGPLVQSNDRFTVAAFGPRILRLRGAEAASLGSLPGARTADDLTPDSRGRALVLSSGELLRFSRGRAPEVVYSLPSG